MRLSEFFHWGEVDRSSKAIEFGIDNSLPRDLRRNARMMHDRILYPLRHFVQMPVHVESWYRSHELNQAVGGSRRSLHRVALAVDIYTHGHTPKQLTQIIIDLALPFDQVIHEKGRWTHVQLPRVGKRPRLMVLTAHEVNGATLYAKGNLPVDPITKALA